MYADAWRKSQDRQVLSPLETQIAKVIEDHPEYQSELGGEALEASFTPSQGKTNPFLHMGLHLSIREQVTTDCPPGIISVFAALSSKTGDAHEAEHQMIDCLAETLWEAQSQNCAPDEQAYLARLHRLTR